jgi:hypothetical protein
MENLLMEQFEPQFGEVSSRLVNGVEDFTLKGSSWIAYLNFLLFNNFKKERFKNGRI